MKDVKEKNVCINWIDTRIQEYLLAVNVKVVVKKMSWTT